MISQTDTLEECYEYLLSFAARGLPAESDTQRDRELREYLERAVTALLSLEGAGQELIAQSKVQPADKFETFFKIMSDDAKKAAAAIEIVSAQQTISSQLVDNLNASMHLRALLTDLFLVTEILNLKPYMP